MLKQSTAVWTHDSAAIEGNTLTLGDTVKVLELGLTISGKSLREYQEIRVSTSGHRTVSCAVAD